ncbi:hypothetical protein [Murimonas intestini]|nr:hypothetical protein [Murimonas intestini]MCR1841572.1 hypothetical protein [Murimonas intestini]
MEQEKSGAFILKKYKDKTPEQFKFLQRQLLDYLSEKNMKENPTCSYAKFVQAKFPAIWEEYIKRG